MARVTTEDELAKAVERGDSTIIIEGDLKQKVIRIKATGRVAWVVAFAAILLAAGAAWAMLPSGGTSGAVSLVTGGAAVAVLGAGSAMCAVRLVIARRPGGCAY